MINFPDNPKVGDAFTQSGTVYSCVSIAPIVWNASPTGVPISDAPTDSKTYGRNNALWKVVDKIDVGLSNANNTSDLNKPISTATQTALNAKENTIPLSAATNYYRGDKTWQALNSGAVGLPNVTNNRQVYELRNGASRIYIGWNGSAEFQVDDTYFGATWPMNITGRSGSSATADNVQGCVIQWRDPGGGNPPYVYCGNSPGDSYVRPPSALSVGYANGAGNVNGIGGWSYSNWGNNPVYLWATEGDGNAQHLTTPGALRVSWANTVGSINGAGGGTVSGDIACAGMNCSNVRTQGGHWWRWHWNGDAGDNHFYAFVDDTNQGWALLNSDERLKQDITYLESDTEAFMRLKPINFRWKPIGAKVLTETTSDGLSAQNVRDCFPNATFGNFEEIPKENGDLEFPGAVDDRGVIAHVILEVQRLIKENEELKGRIAALEA